MVQRPQQLMHRLAVQGFSVFYEDQGNFPKPSIHKLSHTFYLCQGISSLSLPHPRPRILWLNIPAHIKITEKYDPDLIIFDAADEPKEEFASWASYYPEILKKAHLIFASSQQIYDHHSATHPNVHIVRNGVDNAHFSKSQALKPPDLPTGKPIIGYSGAVAPWLDWDLLKIVIRDNPQLEFVFLGTLLKIRRFPLAMSNITYLGLKKYSQLPGYLQHFAIAIIPFRLTAMTKGCNPVKLYEYYATGLPVTATPLPELISVPRIYLENDPMRFSLRLRQIIKKGDLWKNDRIAFAQMNDWSERTSQICKQIQITIKSL
jgi:glycosyltransferase involved in cell wall biosynthesis